MAKSDDYEVTKIIKQRRTARGKLEYRVQWKNYNSDDDTWEPVENLRNCMKLLDEFNERVLREKGPFCKPSPPQSKTNLSKHASHIKQGKNDFRRQIVNSTRTVPQKGDSVSLKRKCPFPEGPKFVFKKERECSNGEPFYSCNGLLAAGPPAERHSPSSVSSMSSSSVNDFDISLKPFHRPRSRSCFPDEHHGSSLDASQAASRRSRLNSLQVGTFNNTDKSLETSTTTPPITPTNGELHVSLTPLLTPVIKLHDLKEKSQFKLPSPKTLLSTEKFLRSKHEHREHEIADRFAGNLSLRKLSYSSSEEEEADRRCSQRQTISVFKYKEIVVKKHPEYTQVWLFTNSPAKNYLGVKALQELTDILEKCSNDTTQVLLLSGSGNVFCSGVDLEKLVVTEHRRRYARNLAEALRVFVDALINFPKVIVAAVNGSAVGLGAAILPLCDVVYSSDKAEFHLPYAAMGQPPEACSSFTFPNAMGLPVACDLLYSGRKMTAQEACASGLVSQVLWPTSFMREVIPRVKVIASNSVKGLQMTKSLVRSHLKAKLEYTNESECAALKDRWASSECAKLIRKYLDR